MSGRSRLRNHSNSSALNEVEKQPFFSKQQDINQSSPKSTFFQAKLSINSPGDSYEREADAVVNQSARVPIVQQKKISHIQRLPTPAKDTTEREKEKLVQRMSADPEKEKPEEIQKKGNPMKEEDQELMPIQTRQDGSTSTGSPQLAARIEQSAGRGNPLPPATTQEMNTSFGTDFSQVRVHDDREAASMNKALNAKAFTHGSDIYFNSGKYNPGSAEGKYLLAHELTHVIQQREEKNIQRQPINDGNAQPAGIENYRRLISEYRELLANGKLSPEDVFESEAAIAQAENAIREAQRVSEAGGSVMGASVGALALSGGLAADDVTGIGVADDVAIPFTLLAAGALYLLGSAMSSSSSEIQGSRDTATRMVTQAITTIGSIVMAAKVGDQVRGLTNQVMIHLARILGTTVGGQPPDHQQDPNRDRPHWWKEIKNFLKQIQDKGLSPRQLLRELRKQFTDEQIEAIKQALRRAAELMGEDPPAFL